MATRKAAAQQSEEVVAQGACPMPMPKAEKQPRKLAEMAEQVRKMREGGSTVPEICQELQMSYAVVNQLTLQSYKMSANTEEVFERQERKRLEAEAA